MSSYLYVVIHIINITNTLLHYIDNKTAAKLLTTVFHSGTITPIKKRWLIL